MNGDINETIKEIKHSFRLLIDDVASQPMRQKGVDYKVNWGVSLPDLQKMVRQCGENRDLTVILWQESVREYKVLAILTMPPEEMNEIPAR